MMSTNTPGDILENVCHGQTVYSSICTQQNIISVAAAAAAVVFV